MSNAINVLLAIGVFALSALWVASGVLFPHHEEEETVETVSAVEVVTQRVRYEPYVRTVRLSGRTEARYMVQVTARTAGIVIDLPVQEGSFVEAGDVIAELSDEARAAAVAEARAQVEESRAQLRAGEELAERGFLPALELEQRRAQLAAAQSALERAITESQRGVITAPVSGVLEQLFAEPGQSLSVGGDVASVLDLDPLVVSAEASERTVAEIQQGATAHVTTLNGQTFDAAVVFVSKAAAGTTRTYRVEAEAPNPDAAIVAGLTTEILIDTPARPAARIPRSAITLNTEGDVGVMLVDAESRAQFAPVALVGDEGESFLIAGPPDGAQMIVVGQEFVASGAPVKAASRPPIPGGNAEDLAALTE
jgi:multidrug efflux system membrane fusion protein